MIHVAHTSGAVVTGKFARADVDNLVNCVRNATMPRDREAIAQWLAETIKAGDKLTATQQKTCVGTALWLVLMHEHPEVERVPEYLRSGDQFMVLVAEHRIGGWVRFEVCCGTFDPCMTCADMIAKLDPGPPPLVHPEPVRQ